MELVETTGRTVEDAKDAALDQLGTQCGCVVVNKAAVLAGDAPDLTDLIAKRIAK